MEEAVQKAIDDFYKPENIRVFVMDVVNGSVTPFIEALSDANQCSPRENADYLSVLAYEYIDSSYRMLKYFDSGRECKTLKDYIHKNNKTAPRVVNYIFTELRNKLQPQAYTWVVGAAIRPHLPIIVNADEAVHENAPKPAAIAA